MFFSTRLLYFSIIATCLWNTGCSTSWSHLRSQKVKGRSFQDVRFQVDNQASELIFKDSLLADSPQNIHHELSYQIESLMNRGKSNPHLSIPVRYRIEVISRNRNYLWTFFPCFFHLTWILGCPLYTEIFKIKMSIEIKDRIYTHQFRHKSYVGWYYNLFDQEPFQKALMKGVKQLFRKMKRSPPKLYSSTFTPFKSSGSFRAIKGQ